MNTEEKKTINLLWSYGEAYGERKMTKIKTINPIVRILWTKKQQIIPNKKKTIPRKQKYRKYTPGAAGFFYV